MVSLSTRDAITDLRRDVYLQAAEDALHRLYLTRTPPELVRLPTMTFPDLDGEEAVYTPGDLGTTEVRLGSAGRSWIVNGIGSE
jgi:hypothetical protein